MYQQSYLLSIDELDGQVQLQVYRPHPVHEEMIILIQYLLPRLGSEVTNIALATDIRCVM